MEDDRSKDDHENRPSIRMPGMQKAACPSRRYQDEESRYHLDIFLFFISPFFLGRVFKHVEKDSLTTIFIKRCPFVNIRLMHPGKIRLTGLNFTAKKALERHVQENKCQGEHKQWQHEKNQLQNSSRCDARSARMNRSSSARALHRSNAWSARRNSLNRPAVRPE